MDSGELCVMMGLVRLMQTLYASNWDTLELHNITIHSCEWYTCSSIMKFN